MAGRKQARLPSVSSLCLATKENFCLFSNVSGQKKRPGSMHAFFVLSLSPERPRDELSGFVGLGVQPDRRQCQVVRAVNNSGLLMDIAMMNSFKKHNYVKAGFSGVRQLSSLWRRGAGWCWTQRTVKVWQRRSQDVLLFLLLTLGDNLDL